MNYSASYFKMEEDEKDLHDDEAMITINDSEYDDSENEEEQDEKITRVPCDTITYAPLRDVEMKSSLTPLTTITPAQSKPTKIMSDDKSNGTISSDEKEMNETVIRTYKWLNRFKTTTCHMFVCHKELEYVKNERFPLDVYIKLYHVMYGNAYEVLVRDCKFYITTKLLHDAKVDSCFYPRETVVKHVDLKSIAHILQLKMWDDLTLYQHILEAMTHVLFIGVSQIDMMAIKNRLISTRSIEKCNNIKKKYSWKSENRKIKNITTTPTTAATTITTNTTAAAAAVNNNFQVEELFKLLYSHGDRPVFKEDSFLNHDKYFQDFQHNVNQLKKPITGYSDHISNVKMLIRDLAMLLYKTNNKNLDLLKNVDGTEQDAELFLRLSKQYPEGDVILNMKTKDTNTQRYRLNCFKMGSVHVWINSMVYSKTKKFQLNEMINQHKWGTHYIISFKYMYNSFMSKLHSEVVKLVLRYILTRRSFDCLESDIKTSSKLTFERLVFL